MPDRIVSRESIAQDAERAARAHIRGDAAPNPWDPLSHPEHFEEWRAHFERVLTSAVPESEASA